MSTGEHWSYVINLGNSVIGVSILAMPYCIKQCGVLLGTFLILSSAYLTKVSCSLLLKSSKSSKTTSYEYLAHFVFGPIGKFFIEVCIIGLMMGTCVAFYVIIGDLAPVTVAGWFGLENTWLLRTVVLVFVAYFIALPLGLMKKIESITNISTLSIGFYIFFTLYIFFKSITKFKSGLWINHLDLIKFEGLFHCLPIFALAFSCQTQLFVVYDALQKDRTERKMMDISKDALNLVSSLYIMVGIFGYIAYIQDGIKGDILLNFRASFIADLFKFGFAMSVALSFPMMIFPCRKSINTLLFGQQSLENPGISGADYIPPSRFSFITISIISITLLIAIIIPNVETILSVTGATMGCLISYIFPSLMFIMSVQKGPGRGRAQAILFIGLLIFVASTYTSLNPGNKDVMNEIKNDREILEDNQLKVIKEQNEKIVEQNIIKLPKSEKISIEDKDVKEKIISGEENSKRREFDNMNRNNLNHHKLLNLELKKEDKLDENQVIAELIEKQEKQDEILKQQKEEINKLKKQQNSLEQAAIEMKLPDEKIIDAKEYVKNDNKIKDVKIENVEKLNIGVKNDDNVQQQQDEVVKPIENNIKFNNDENPPKIILKQDEFPLKVKNVESNNIDTNKQHDLKNSDYKIDDIGISNDKVDSEKVDSKADFQIPIQGNEKDKDEIGNKETGKVDGAAEIGNNFDNKNDKIPLNFKVNENNINGIGNKAIDIHEII